MWGGKSAREARVHSYSSSSYSRFNKSKSDWSKYDWMQEVASEVNGRHIFGDYTLSGKANVDSIVVEAFMQIYKEDIPYSSIREDAKYAVQNAVRKTGCPYDVSYNIKVYEK